MDLLLYTLTGTIVLFVLAYIVGLLIEQNTENKNFHLILTAGFKGIIWLVKWPLILFMALLLAVGVEKCRNGEKKQSAKADLPTETIEIRNISQDYDIGTNIYGERVESYKGLKIEVEKDSTTYYTLYFYDDNGNQLKDFDNHDSIDGYVGLDGSNDSEQYISLDQLHYSQNNLENNGGRIKVEAIVYDSKDNIIVKSKPYSFVVHR